MREVVRLRKEGEANCGELADRFYALKKLAELKSLEKKKYIFSIQRESEVPPTSF